MIRLENSELVSYWLDTAERDHQTMQHLYSSRDYERQQDLLDLFTTFNISARYPDYKESFYRKCTPEYTAERLREIEEIRTWLLSNLKR